MPRNWPPASKPACAKGRSSPEPGGGAGAGHAALLDRLAAIAVAAGAAIPDFRAKDLAVARKDDASPVTAADRAAEAVVLERLAAAFPGVPVVAEEAVAEGHVPPAIGRKFFLVDALDGTREFLRGSREFTVNIALVEDGTPSHGVICAPALGRIFAGGGGRAVTADVGADGAPGPWRPIAVRPCAARPLALVSRSYRTEETGKWLRNHGIAETRAVGSSLKFCLLAAGEADFYPRPGRTMEWDTAAGHAVLSAAGGRVETLDGAPLRYGKRSTTPGADFANAGFVARGGG